MDQVSTGPRIGAIFRSIFQTKTDIIANERTDGIGFLIMGVEGRDKQKALEAGAVALSGQLGKTVQRLRKAYNLSLSELSEQSGVAKSIISQIERNETNPTLATIWRLAQALDVSIDRVLRDNAHFTRRHADTGLRRRQMPPRHHRLDQDRGMAAML
jgi:transcriptional regulator with XRE-family HTH domain